MNHEKISSYVSPHALDKVLSRISHIASLADKNIFMLHSSALVIDDDAFLFCGPHGAGKSTILEKLSSFGHTFNDDKNCIMEKEHNFYLIPRKNVFDESIETSKPVILKKIFLLTKEYSLKSSATPFTDKDRLWRFFFTQVGFIPDKSINRAIYPVLNRFVDRDIFYNLNHNLADTREYLAELVKDGE